jgi:protein arginine N-methyltransferase 1
MDMDDPPRVDVVVSETLGNYPFEENTIETLNDARCRFLKTGGVIIPGRLEQFVAPAVSERIHSELSAWEEVEFDIDLSPAMTMTLNNIYVRSMAPKELLDNGASAKTWDELVPGIVLSTAPNAPRTHWEQLYLPLLKPMKASGGETVTISLRSRTSMEEGTHVAWTATRLNAKGQRLEHQALNLDKGFLP